MHKDFTIWKRTYSITYFDDYINEGFDYLFITLFLLIDYEVDMDEEYGLQYYCNFDFDKLKVLFQNSKDKYNFIPDIIETQ